MRKLLFIIFLFVLVSPELALAQSQEASYRSVRNTDNLFRIAEEVRPNEDVSVQQTMLALLAENPEAFAENNINSLKNGHVLRVPAAENIQNIAEESAIQEVKRQNQHWRKNKQSQSKPKAKPSKSSKSKFINLAQKKSAQAADSKADPVPQATEPHGLRQEMLGMIQQLQQNLDEVMKSDSQLQMAMNSRLNSLEQQNQTLRTQMLQMDQKMASLDQQLQQFVVQYQKEQRGFVQKATAFFQSQYGKVGIANLLAILGGVLGLFFLFFLVKRLRNARKKDQINKKAEQLQSQAHDPYAADTDDEYDFMNSEEGVVAKLDLARAYIDMGDMDSAQEALQQVLKQGNAVQKQEAQALLNQL